MYANPSCTGTAPDTKDAKIKNGPGFGKLVGKCSDHTTVWGELWSDCCGSGSRRKYDSSPKGLGVSCHTGREVGMGRWRVSRSLPRNVFISLNPFLRSPHSSSLVWDDVRINHHRILSPDWTRIRAPGRPIQRLASTLQECLGSAVQQNSVQWWKCSLWRGSTWRPPIIGSYRTLEIWLLDMAIQWGTEFLTLFNFD